MVVSEIGRHWNIVRYLGTLDSKWPPMTQPEGHRPKLFPGESTKGRTSRHAGFSPEGKTLGRILTLGSDAWLTKEDFSSSSDTKMTALEVYFKCSFLQVSKPAWIFIVKNKNQAGKYLEYLNATKLSRPERKAGKMLIGDWCTIRLRKAWSYSLPVPRALWAKPLPLE